MRLRIVSITLLSSYAAAAAAAAGQETTIPVSRIGPTQSNTLAVHIAPVRTSQDRAKLWNALEQTAEPTKLLVPASHTVENVVRTRCGGAPPDLLAKLASLNPGLNEGAESSDRTLRFIPCPYWNAGVLNSQGMQITPPKIPVRKGEDITPIVLQYTGSAGPDRIAQVLRLNPKLVDRASGTVRANGELSLPFVARPAIVTLAQPQTADTAALSVQALAKSLPDAQKNNLSVALLPNEYQLVAVDDPAITDPLIDCRGPADTSNWPVNIEALKDAVNATLALTPATLLKTKPESVVVIADTGVRLSDQAVVDRLWENLALLGGVIDPTSPFKNDPHGVSVVTLQGKNSDIEPATDYPFAGHGTDIAHVLIEAAVRNNQLDKRFSIAVVKLNAQTPPYGIHVSTIPTALSYARRIRATAINLSVVTGATSEELEHAFHASDALIVSAAGNNGDMPEVIQVFPPALGIFREKFIVVGAHNWEREIARFSNFSSTSVDILAPGCAIPMPGSDPAHPRWVSGTSFAAPFVTYAAAMLRALNFPQSANLVRSRILASGRFNSNLINVTKYGVTLDTARAMRFREDSYLPNNTDKPIYGTVDPVQNFLCKISEEKSRNSRPRDILKIIPKYPGKGGKLVPMIWTQPASKGPLIETLCRSDFSTPSFRFKANEEADFKDIFWSDVQDVVMRSTAN